MKCKGIAFICLVLLAVAVSVSARTWTDKSGNELEAEYKGMKNGKVILEKPDGKQLEIDIDLLSIKDQVYLDPSRATAATANGDNSGSKSNDGSGGGKGKARIKFSDAKEIAQKFAEALDERDFNTWKSLMLDPGNWNSGSFKYKLDSELEESSGRRVTIKTVDPVDYGFVIDMQMTVTYTSWGGAKNEVERSYWLQMLPDGKIKYDNLFIDHPIAIAIDWCGENIASENKLEWYSGIYYGRWPGYRGPSEMERLGIHIFGWDRETEHLEKLKCLKELRKWLLDEGETWDKDEPKLPCPKELYKVGKRVLKQF